MIDDWASLIRQVKEANDIVDVVGGYLSLRPAGQTFKGLCPFHDDHRPSFDVDPRRQRYRCWSCGKHGDVLSFIQEQERVDFREALELLARRAGISLKNIDGIRQNPARAAMLDQTRWATEQFHQCLLDSPLAESARRYLGERHFTGETIRKYALGFAPGNGEWLVRRAEQGGQSLELLEKLGLIAPRREGQGFYDRFRDRVIFPIRDARGQPVGFGGRILPSSEAEGKAPKYYNSADTPLFTKSEHLYGLDQARAAGVTAGYLAIVEGYTDVLMAHQQGVLPVVATMGTALNARHVRHLRRFVPRVVLVFDADAAGESAVDRALEIFVSEEVDLAIATLPAGLDPFDLLVQQGPEPFRAALTSAVDALEFKLNRVLAAETMAGGSVEAKRKAVESLLQTIARAPVMAGEGGAVKRELMIGRIARRLALREETLWARLQELRQGVTSRERQRPETDSEPQEGPASPLEKQLLQVLLAEPALVEAAAAALTPEHVRHPGLRRLLEGLYALHAEGQPIDLDQLRLRIDNPRLIEAAMRLQEQGRLHVNRTDDWLRDILTEFRKRQLEPEKQKLKNQLHSADDHTEAVELLRRMQMHQ